MMKGEAEIRRVLKLVEESLRCPYCKKVEPGFFYDGDVECKNCHSLIVAGSWFELGVWKALKWVLGELSDEELEKE